MIKISSYWAGQLVSSDIAYDESAVAQKLSELKEGLRVGNITHSSCGHTFVLSELCVDVLHLSGSLTFHNLKS